MLKLYTYSLPFKSPFKTADLVFKNREGLILVFEFDGITAFGEIAPLPGFSNFELPELIKIVQINKSAIEKALIEDEFEQFSYVLNQIHNAPSLRFGLDTLFHDYKSKKAGLTLADFLFKKDWSPTVESNGTLGASDYEVNILRAKKLVEQGFNTLKIKVGIDFEKEFEFLVKLRELYPDIKLRIDANQSWDFKQAVKNLKRFETLDLEYCEEPLLSSKSNQLSRLKEQTNINLAADESFRNKTDAKRLIQQNAVNIFILKPMMFGSFSEINVTKQLANSHYNDVIFTTSLESTIGRTMTAILASGLGSKNYAHGLATESIFSYNLGTTQEINSGSFQIPEKSGLGIDLNFNHLEEII